MNLNKLKSLYLNSPLIFKEIYALIPFRIRNGKIYRMWREKLKQQTIDDRNPSDTLKYAISNFKVYSELYNSIDTNNWEKIPFIDKYFIQKYISEFELFSIPKFYVTTGGVTGKPAKFFQSNNIWYKELAFVYDYFEKHGYKSTMLKASFRGGDFSHLKPNIFWKSNPNYNEIHFSPFHINSKTIEKYVERLNKIQPKYFHGYPSAFISLARVMNNNGLKLNYKLKCIFLISEGFKKEDVEFLQSTFNCEVSSFYGHSERLIFAEASKDLNYYIPNPLYGYLELIDEYGNVIKNNNVVGELVATSYDNLAMPLIRYKTGDYTHYIDYNTKSFAPLKGKWGQMNLIGINGEEISLTALNLHSNELNSIQKIQFVQNQKGKVILNVMFETTNNEFLIKSLSELLTNRVGGLIHFDLNETEEFILNLRGKMPLIVDQTVNH
jgi:phenylacetate-CoA ligase